MLASHVAVVFNARQSLATPEALWRQQHTGRVHVFFRDTTSVVAAKGLPNEGPSLAQKEEMLFIMSLQNEYPITNNLQQAPSDCAGSFARITIIAC